jgi:hypothetical protein
VSIVVGGFGRLRACIVLAGNIEAVAVPGGSQCPASAVDVCVVTVDAVRRSVGGDSRGSRVGIRSRGQFRTDMLGGNHDRRVVRFGDEIRSLNGYQSFKVNFQQRGIADIMGLIG